MHSIAGIPSPTTATIALEALEAAKRKNARPISQKAALTSIHFKQILTEFAGPNASLVNLHLAAMVICGFLGFIRADEIVNAKMRDLSFNSDCAIIRITKAKNDQFKHGKEVKIAQTGGDYCPVIILCRYRALLRSSQETSNPDLPLFPTFRVSKGMVQALRKPIAYDRLRNEIKTAMQKLGLQANLFGTHSMRRGGATAAAAAKVPERALQNHGRWRSASIKDRYIEPTKEEQLLVSTSILRNLD